jgi:hypothetical protein
VLGIIYTSDFSVHICIAILKTDSLSLPLKNATDMQAVKNAGQKRMAKMQGKNARKNAREKCKGKTQGKNIRQKCKGKPQGKTQGKNTLLNCIVKSHV